MRSFGIVLIIGLLSLFLQGTVFKTLLPESSIVPNLMLIVVAYLAFHEASVLGLLLSFMLGLLFDLGSGALLGPWAGAFVVVFMLLTSMTQRIFVDSPLTAFVAVLLGALVAQGIYLGLYAQFRTLELLPMASGLRVLLEALASAVCAPICFAILRKLPLIRQARIV